MDKRILNIGEVKGKMLFFGGVYSNLQALEKLVAIAGEEQIDPKDCFCTGDLIGYCAQPEETINLFREWGATSIKGNVEEQLSSGAENCGCDFREGGRCDSLSQIWYPYAQSKLSASSLAWLNTLPDHIGFTLGKTRGLIVHGSFNNISEYIFKSTAAEQKKESFESSASDLIIAGHCGLPFHDTLDGKLWLNPGVIGMPPNDGTTKVWYMIMERSTEWVTFSFRNYEYEASRTADLMRKAGLPEAYSETLETGIWDNMEILPEKEKEKQAIPVKTDSLTLTL
jgi:predicted phosphodiesterase